MRWRAIASLLAASLLAGLLSAAAAGAVAGSGPRAVKPCPHFGLSAGSRRYRYVQTGLIAELPFPVDRARRGCVVAGR